MGGIRTLYGWLIGTGVACVALVGWFTPGRPVQPAPTPQPAAANQKVIVNVRAPQQGFPPGAVVMASFPELHRSLPGKVLPGSGPQLQIEFEVPGQGAPAEIWAQSPAGGGRIRWQSPAAMPEVETPSEPRDIEAYQPPAPKARAEKQSLPAPPAGFPQGFQPLNQDQLKAMAERHGGRAPKK